MRRLQANLAYLANVADRKHRPENPVPPFPAIMEAPVLPGSGVGNSSGGTGEGDGENNKGGAGAEGHVKKEDGPENGGGNKDSKEILKEMYTKLKELWPEYKGKNGPAPAAGPPTTAGAPAAQTL